MPWVRIDDAITEHPKLARVGPLGLAMQVAGLAYCNRNLTDGFIPRAIARTLVDWELVDRKKRVWTIAVTSGQAGNDVTCQWVTDLLVEAGVWEMVKDGYRIHDYDRYQPTKAAVEAERAATNARVTAFRAKKKQPSNGKVTPTPVPDVPTVHKRGAFARREELPAGPQPPKFTGRCEECDASSVSAHADWCSKTKAMR